MNLSFLGLVAAGTIALSPGFAAAQSDTISSVDRATIVRALEESNQHFLASLTGVEDAQWRFKPAPNRWSIAEVAEHLTLIEQQYFEMIRGGLDTIAPIPPDSAARLEAAVRSFYGDRTQKMNSPEGFVPTGRWATQAELVADYNAARKVNLEYARTTRDPLRARGAPHPALGLLDSTHHMMVVAAHMERHLHQIEDIKKAQGYPR